MGLSRDIHRENLEKLQTKLLYIINEGTEEDIAIFKNICGLVDNRYHELNKHKKEQED